MLGFIGVGSMGGALLRGVIESGKVKAGDVVFSRRDETAGKALAEELGAHYVRTNADVVRAVRDGIVILAVKPFQIASVLEEIKDAAASARCVIVSVAAGTPIAALEAGLAPEQPIVRSMPNVASAIGAGMTAFCPNEHVNSDQLAAVETVLKTVGLTAQVAEKDFSAFSAIAGCSPAWTFTYIDALSRAAVAAGMYKSEAVRIAAQAVYGAAALALKSLDDGVRPLALVDTVTSPGGTTIAGLVAAERAGFSDATVQAVEAAVARDQAIARGEA